MWGPETTVITGKTLRKRVLLKLSGAARKTGRKAEKAAEKLCLDYNIDKSLEKQHLWCSTSTCI